MRTGPPTQRAGVTLIAAALILTLATLAGRCRNMARRRPTPSPPSAIAVLAEMRAMLGSVSGILHGLTAKDRQATEKAARLPA